MAHISVEQCKLYKNQGHILIQSVALALEQRHLRCLSHSVAQHFPHQLAPQDHPNCARCSEQEARKLRQKQWSALPSSATDTEALVATGWAGLLQVCNWILMSC